MRRTLAVLVALAAAAPPLAGQGIPRTAWNDARNGVSDMVRIWAAPLHADADDLPAIAATAGGALLLYAYDARLQDWVRGHQGTAAVRSTSWFREGKQGIKLGSGDHLMTASAVLYVPGLLLNKPGLREAGLGCATAVEAGSLMRQVIYATISRARPSITDNPREWDVPGGDWDHHAFFGGHGANAMTCVSFLNTRFRLGAVEPVLYAAALGVALGRTADLRHWPSDTFIGVVTGYAIGRFEARRMAERQARREQRDQQAAPPEGGALGLLRDVRVLPGAGGTVQVGFSRSF